MTRHSLESDRSHSECPKRLGDSGSSGAGDCLKSTIGGALGADLESDEVIREAAYACQPRPTLPRLHASFANNG
jgi:hypothetical protein